MNIHANLQLFQFSSVKLKLWKLHTEESETWHYIARYSVCLHCQSFCASITRFRVHSSQSIQSDYNDRHSVCLYCQTFSLNILQYIQCDYNTRHSVCLYCQAFGVNILQDTQCDYNARHLSYIITICSVWLYRQAFSVSRLLGIVFV